MTRAWKGWMERALFVVGPCGSGKSTALRSMFLDRRLGTRGVVPTTRKVKELHALSNERWLYLRLTSPHEVGESLSEFLSSIERKCDESRWCFASPLRPLAMRRMPDSASTVRAFVNRFEPERVRVAFLSPTYDGKTLDEYGADGRLVRELGRIRNVEAVSIPVGRKRANGLLLADYFDFT